MGPEQHLRWIYTRLAYYRKCQKLFQSESNEFLYLKERIKEFEELIGDVIRDYFQVA